MIRMLRGRLEAIQKKEQLVTQLDGFRDDPLKIGVRAWNAMDRHVRRWAGCSQLSTWSNVGVGSFSPVVPPRTDGRLSPDSFRARRMPVTAESGQEETFDSFIPPAVCGVGECCCFDSVPRIAHGL